MASGARGRDVLRVADTKLLLTNQRVEEGDTLRGCSLGQIVEGYGVMVVSLTLESQTRALLLPKPSRARSRSPFGTMARRSTADDENEVVVSDENWCDASFCLEPTGSRPIGLP
jgi:hypothetical protein